jgi:hypothetical protein
MIFADIGRGGKINPMSLGLFTEEKQIFASQSNLWEGWVVLEESSIYEVWECCKLFLFTQSRGSFGLELRLQNGRDRLL